MTKPSPAPAPAPQALPAAEQRLQWLFRDSLRRGQIHPLLQVLRRYRQGHPA